MTDEAGSGAPCANCGAALTGAYCAACGQRAGIHRSLRGLVEELAQDVLKLDVRLTRTLPLLVFRPGKLTREYIQGRRRAYLSPIGAFVFVLFVMLFVFGMMESFGVEPGGADGGSSWARSASGLASDALQDAPAAPARSGVTSGDVQDLAYMLSFLLVPVSLPFVSLLFLGRPGVTAFDHTVFLYYSISFMLLLFLLQVVLDAIWPSLVARYLGQVFMAIPVVHILFQTKGTYGLGWPGALWRTVALLFIAGFVLTLYVVTLFAALMLAQ